MCLLRSHFPPAAARAPCIQMSGWSSHVWSSLQPCLEQRGGVKTLLHSCCTSAALEGFGWAPLAGAVVDCRAYVLLPARPGFSAGSGETAPFTLRRHLKCWHPVCWPCCRTGSDGGVKMEAGMQCKLVCAGDSEILLLRSCGICAVRREETEKWDDR